MKIVCYSVHVYAINLYINMYHCINEYYNAKTYENDNYLILK